MFLETDENDMRRSGTTEIAFGFAWFVVMATILALFAWAIFDAVFAETFSLRKDSWACTDRRLETSLTTITDADGRMQTVPTVHEVCAQWTRTR